MKFQIELEPTWWFAFFLHIDLDIYLKLYQMHSLMYEHHYSFYRRWKCRTAINFDWHVTTVLQSMLDSVATILKLCFQQSAEISIICSSFWKRNLWLAEHVDSIYISLHWNAFPTLSELAKNIPSVTSYVAKQFCVFCL